MNSTLPGSCSRTRASVCATPMRIAVCVSWPHACMTPTVSPRYVAVARERNGTSVFSVTGNASMSARSAIVGPGRPPSSSATTPVFAMPVCGVRPMRFRCSATSLAVRTSRFESSGFW
jgi:hypothetical protein